MCRQTRKHLVLDPLTYRHCFSYINLASSDAARMHAGLRGEGGARARNLQTAHPQPIRCFLSFKFSALVRRMPADNSLVSHSSANGPGRWRLPQLTGRHQILVSVASTPIQSHSTPRGDHLLIVGSESGWSEQPSRQNLKIAQRRKHTIITAVTYHTGG